MKALSDKQLSALKGMCNAYIPSIEKDGDPYWSRKASDLEVHLVILEMLKGVTEEEQKELLQAIDLLSSPLLGLTWFGPLKSVDKLTQEQSEKMLQSWSKSSIPPLRKAFATFKKLTTYIYFGYSGDRDVNPNWPVIQYPGPTEKIGKKVADPIQVLRPSSDQELTCDVVIIGSGAGGSVVAAELAKAGQDVIIVEKGPFVLPHEMTQREVEMITKLYDRNGIFASKDGGTGILAGSCVGGGTTVNWAGMFRTPDYVLEEWSKEHGNPQFTDKEFLKGFEFIEERTKVIKEPVVHNPQNNAIVVGGKKLGYKVDVVPRNYQLQENIARDTSYHKCQGYATLGDNQGDKLGTMLTFLKDAHEAGARLLADTYAERITTTNGTATGVEGWYKSSENKQYKITIKAKRVVVAAGALHSPALLRRSGLKHPHIGKHLYLHPVNAVSALYEQKMESWYGPMMSAVCDEFTQLDGNFGFKIETPPIHSGFYALAMPWMSARQLKEEMKKISQMGLMFGLVRDKFGGQVKLSKKGLPVVNYKLSAYDKKHFIRGMQECVKIHTAAGATQVRILHNQRILFDPAKDNLETFLSKIESLRWETNRYSLFSAHQMGTCRMGGTDKDYPVKPSGETREVKNLFVADASTFPKCSGSNPMLSIMAIAYYIAQGLKT